MCGITGIIANYSLSNDELARTEVAIKRLKKRGPDAAGIVSYDSTVLGHRRLSIIDTNSASNQPMEDASKRYSIVLMERFITIRDLKDLIEKGYQFKNESDTEVLLNGYDCYGTVFF
ncbi:hypothetical protein N8371_03800 [Vicingaceae bacterium]|nr:hypothetical protein [Vicingaceae bacterium]MDC1451521.1 hypothetical protein [Vicingaceae bacterium]